VARLSEEKEACYRELVRADGVPEVPGSVAWMARFHAAGIRQALATSGNRANATLIVERTGIAPYLDAVVAAEDAPRGKPHPDLFLVAATRIGVPPARCLVIEDSLHGIRAARAAGMRCLALATTHRLDELDGYDLALPDMQAFTWETWEALMGNQT